MRCRNRGDRKHVDDMAVIRKMRIVHMLSDYWYYPAPGDYRKGKIHCSCPICKAKTNGSSLKSHGPVDQAREEGTRRHPHGTRIMCTNGRYGRKHYKPADMRKVDRLIYREDEYSQAC